MLPRLVLTLLLSVISVQAFASDCYRAQEAEAEQGIRIHSELMVIGLGCQHMSQADGKNLYVAYREFTAKHQNLFDSYERILLEYFRDNGMSPQAAETKLRQLRTSFANKISNDQAEMRPDMFCTRYAPRIMQTMDLKQADVRKWAATIFPSHPVSKPLCDGQLVEQ